VRCVVVFAHPDPASYGAAVGAAVGRGVVAGGGDITEVLDLYGDGYRPSTPLPDRHRSALESATMLVVVHPTWWTAQPAILLGWLQRLAAERWPTIATLVEVATHGGPKLGNVVAGRAGRRTAIHVTRAVSAGGARYRWVPCYGVDRASADRRSAMLGEVESRLTHITRRLARSAARPGRDTALVR